MPATAASDPALEVLYRDDDLVAITKPSGMLVHYGWARDDRPALQRLRDQIGTYVYPVHRLDRATSGVLLFALSPESASAVQGQLAARTAHKVYLALCRGHSDTVTHVDHPLAPEKGKAPVPAVTDFELLGHFERYGLFRALPRTGRTHQIRRHLKHVSHPIIGDVRYGKGEHNRIFRERFGFKRLALHAIELRLQHPKTGAELCIRSPLPRDLDELFDATGLRQRALAGC